MMNHKISKILFCINIKMDKMILYTFKIKKSKMYSDSDNDRDASLDIQFDTNALGSPKSNGVPPNPNITPDSKYDRSFSFSDDDEQLASSGQTPPRSSAKLTEEGTPVATGYGNSRYSSNYRDSYQPDTNSGDNYGGNDDYGGENDYGASSEFASLFSLISNFQPEPVEISVHWKPFIPELIPAIGAIDAFIKVPRPDSEFDDLGLVILDEPSISQSNPQVLRMELREQCGITSPGNESDGYIGFIEDVQKNRKALDSWLESIEEIHRNRPPPTLIYSSQMPELEDLMQPWDETFEETLQACPLPTAELDCSLEDYAKIICALLEIPVKGNIIESLHHLFSLYAQFEGNHYFRSQAGAV
ncbi:Intraflagellar transport protein 46 like protein [Tritrichomonas foetus]|uniref:Intraflagellar transport protein 46 like protein n=1 Tax=Tritrichomonas foetus TaxID=1144522 RepID=A0A1J4KMY0_9EUKA|nr:Intraflagellar transport protein 46 like protein [Tritrichomonas foetus]|eukprot:OHT10741.1 Intraflagellar transport protein 46 like protein [Tritrichomonas foetus]